MPMINIEDAYILDNTGEQVDDAVDYGLFNSNENLLDNAYFVGGGSQLGYGIFPINQRGQTQYTGGGVQLDRWHGWAGTDTLVLTANGLQYTSPSSNGIFQYFPVFPTPQTVTFSVKVSGTIKSITLAEGTIHAEEDFSGYKLTVDRNDKCVGIFSLNETILLQAAKLEVGTVSTLANDAPPDFGEELRKCQRYLWIVDVPANTQLGSGIALAADQADISITLPVPMRTPTTPAFTTNVLLIGNGQIHNASAVTGIDIYDNNCRLMLSSAGLTPYYTYSFWTGAQTRMIISAEL